MKERPSFFDSAQAQENRRRVREGNVLQREGAKRRDELLKSGAVDERRAVGEKDPKAALVALFPDMRRLGLDDEIARFATERKDAFGQGGQDINSVYERHTKEALALIAQREAAQREGDARIEAAGGSLENFLEDKGIIKPDNDAREQRPAA